ncbi:DNA polymerase III subunit gamma and tau [Oerskovia turbata]|uniref:DNA-directed DNA polymerase n=1 Tax=Oerskovia turbata TaxID=1713 RepID=A0A4Q1L0W0_9CELL|nr:DNA polymerase III subunit gamma and tau [Oerskovia turbata]RXR27069.1 DNA polymerase III subunit gamma and tau [Oerskovia turbata]RXR36363.1 DNA polymerase III subunit gamma and tau [Oerskovia turbata]
MSTALYRRYRPETFAEVIGQDHVTGPLRQALRSGRVNHAYLFSGPRGCGKTTSARILARTLNCARNTEETPIDTPCGECSSCIELARGGSGSLDVIEIDAASHNGVDDARELRERATFAPARDRYKIFILDEAHMVTPQGFNALLKLVEEPPPHVKFIFATTEPDKVIGTIRSRTHHYPFRLVPPDVLGPYLEQLCAAEGVTIGTGVVPLVVRSGGGSVRDSLSVMDQLIAGAEAGSVDYERAVDLLGFTHASLLDDVVEALAARDGASIFRVVEQIITTGHEPRRFVEDLLERLRDLIVISVSGGAADAVLRDVPSDQLDRMKTQAQNLGAAELSRAADLVNAALTEMSGATSPRLHLELLCARLLLPGVDDGAAGLAARIDRLERGGLGAGGLAPAASAPRPGGPEGLVAAPRVARVEDAAPAAPVNGLSGAAAARAALQARKAGEGAAAAPAVPTAAVPAGTSAPGGSDAAAEAVPSSAPVESDDWPVVVPVGTVEPATNEPGTAARAAAPVDAADTFGVSPVEGDGQDAGGTTPLGSVTAPGDVRVDPAPAPAPAAPAPAPAPVVTAPPAPADPPTAPAPVVTPAPAASDADALSTDVLRRRWPEVLQTLSSSRVTWSLVSGNAQVGELTPDTLYLAFQTPALARTFSTSRHTGAVQEAVYQTLGFQVRVEARLDEGGGSGPSNPAPVAPPAPHHDEPSGAGEPTGGSTSTGAGPAAPAQGGPAADTAVPHATVPHATVPPTTVPPTSAERVGVVSAPTAPNPSAGHHGTGGPDGTSPAGAGLAASSQHSNVALQERPAARSAVAAPPAHEVEPAVNAADEAWLAGLPVTEPPADLDEDHEPPPADVRRAAPSGSVQRPAVPPAASAPSAPSAPTPAGPAPGVRETRRQTLERQAAEQKARQSAARVTVSMDDDSPSDDDPDLASSGLVGAPLVAQLLGGVVIDETIDTGI